ncbi:hypothetical protein CR513_57268, partial [Mucuna pruriens]
MNLDLTLWIEKSIPTPENLEESQSARKFFEELNNEKAETSNLLAKLISMKYGYLYLIHEKSQSLGIFKSFKAEVKLQLGKKIKAIKSYHGSEYYGRYDGLEYRPWPFFIFLKDCGIVPQYTIPSKPNMNNVTERQKQTLKDMMRKTGNTRFLEEVEFGKEENIRNVDFKEESINDIGQVLVPITVQETTIVLRNHSIGILRLSQKNYINKVLENFDMKDSKPRDIKIVKGDKFSLK